MSLQEFNDRMHKLAENGKLQCPCGNNDWEDFIFAGFGAWSEATCKRCDSLFRTSGDRATRIWKQQLFTVRLQDGSTGQWIDISDPLPRNEAKHIWLQKTENGTKHTFWQDGGNRLRRFSTAKGSSSDRL